MLPLRRTRTLPVAEEYFSPPHRFVTFARSHSPALREVALDALHEPLTSNFLADMFAFVER